MSLIKANVFSQAAVMLNDGKEITDEEKAEIKAIFLEGLIRFLDIYSQTEIGEGIEIDITKIALFVNSPRFENEDLYIIKSIYDVYKLLEDLSISGLPIWRFLRLTEYQQKIFENGYNELLISSKKQAASISPCYGCIWYNEIETDFGVLRRCSKPEAGWKNTRDDSFELNEITDCEWLTTLDKIPDAIYSSDIIDIRRKQFLNSVESARKRFKEKLSEDPYRIPKELSAEEIVRLDKDYEPIADLLCAFREERTYRERQDELRRAMYIEGMIRFFEMYAECEIGSGYTADIKNIALYVDGLENSNLTFIRTYEDVYTDLENKILSGFDVKPFINLSVKPFDSSMGI